MNFGHNSGLFFVWIQPLLNWHVKFVFKYSYMNNKYVMFVSVQIWQD